MSMAVYVSLLLLGIAIIVLATAVLKISEEVDEINKEIGYLFDWLSEENRKINKLDDIVQELERK